MNLLARSMRAASCLLLLLLVSACGQAVDPAAPTGPGPTAPGGSVGQTSEVTRVPLSAAIRLRNIDAVPRNYLLFEAEVAALVDPNLDPAGSAAWTILDPGQEIRIPLDAIPGWTQGARAIYVYTWTKSVAYQVGGGTQWLAEGWEAIRLDL